MLVELRPHIHLGSLDGTEDELCNTLTLHIDEVGLEESLGGLKPLPTNLDDPTIGQSVRLDQERGLLQDEPVV